MRLRALALCAALAVAVVPTLAGSAASVDTVVGQDFEPRQPCSGPVTVFQTSSASPSHTVPTVGVITLVRVVGAIGTGSTRAFRLARPQGTGLEVVGGTPTVTIGQGETLMQETRLPARPGDVLGAYIGDVETSCMGYGDPSDAIAVYDGDVAAGSSLGPSPRMVPRHRIPVVAFLEPDADGDGYGDTTQDQCPSQAATQGACRDVTAPQTLISSVQVPRIKGVKHHRPKKTVKVTVLFGSAEPSTFACSVDGAGFASCSHPLDVVLTKGVHTISIRATDLAGNTDPTPAVATFEVRRAPKAKRVSRATRGPTPRSADSRLTDLHLDPAARPS